MDKESMRNLQIRRDFVGRELKANITDLADHLFGLDQMNPYADYEEFANYIRTACSECGEDVGNLTSIRHIERINGRGMVVQYHQYYTCPHCGCDFSDCEISEQSYAEPMEFYIVSEFLGRQLEKHGEMVLSRMLGWIWGRQCSGQAVYMDGVISDICAEIGILEDDA